MRNYLIILLSVLGIVVLASCNTKNTNKKASINNTNITTDSLQIDSLTQLIKQHPKVVEYYDERSKLYQQRGKLSLSINDLILAQSLDSLNIDYYIRLSDMYLQFGKSELCHKLLLKANKIDAENLEVLYRLGNLYFYVKDYKKAISYLKQAKDTDPFYAPIYFTFGMITKENHDTLKAIEYFQIAVEREPQYYDAYIMLGALCSALNDSLAIDYYKNALRIIPQSYEAAYGLAYAYQINDKPEQAIETYLFMLSAISNKLPYVYYNLGYIQMIIYGNYEQAISYFDSSLLIQPQYAGAYANKGYCYEKLNNLAQARNNYMEALKLEPNMDVAVLGLNRLDN